MAQLIVCHRPPLRPVVRWIRDQARQAGTATLLVHLGRPRVDLDLFRPHRHHAAIQPAAGPNVMEHQPADRLCRRDAASWAGLPPPGTSVSPSLPRPWHAVLVGGPTPQLAFGGEEPADCSATLTAWQAPPWRRAADRPPRRGLPPAGDRYPARQPPCFATTPPYFPSRPAAAIPIWPSSRSPTISSLRRQRVDGRPGGVAPETDLSVRPAD